MQLFAAAAMIALTPSSFALVAQRSPQAPGVPYPNGGKPLVHTTLALLKTSHSRLYHSLSQATR